MTNELMLYTVSFCRMMMSLVFLISAIGKIMDFKSFECVVNNFQILPHRFNRIAASTFIRRNTGFIACICIGAGARSTTQITTSTLNIAEWALVGMMAGVFMLIWLSMRDVLELVS